MTQPLSGAQDQQNPGPGLVLLQTDQGEVEGMGKEEEGETGLRGFALGQWSTRRHKIASIRRQQSSCLFLFFSWTPFLSIFESAQ